MEKATYRLILADLLDFSGGIRTFTARDVANYLGISRPTVIKRYGIRKSILAPELAHLLANENERR